MQVYFTQALITLDTFTTQALMAIDNKPNDPTVGGITRVK